MFPSRLALAAAAALALVLGLATAPSTGAPPASAAPAAADDVTVYTAKGMAQASRTYGDDGSENHQPSAFVELTLEARRDGSTLDWRVNSANIHPDARITQVAFTVGSESELVFQDNDGREAVAAYASGTSESSSARRAALFRQAEEFGKPFEVRVAFDVDDGDSSFYGTLVGDLDVSATRPNATATEQELIRKAKWARKRARTFGLGALVTGRLRSTQVDVSIARAVMNMSARGKRTGKRVDTICLIAGNGTTGFWAGLSQVDRRDRVRIARVTQKVITANQGVDVCTAMTTAIVIYYRGDLPTTDVRDRQHFQARAGDCRTTTLSVRQKGKKGRKVTIRAKKPRFKLKVRCAFKKSDQMVLTAKKRGRHTPRKVLGKKTTIGATYAEDPRRRPGRLSLK